MVVVGRIGGGALPDLKFETVRELARLYVVRAIVLGANK